MITGALVVLVLFLVALLHKAHRDYCTMAAEYDRLIEVNERLECELHVLQKLGRRLV
jgi:hypothetical protein